MKLQGDVDIDVADRLAILALIEHTPAAMRNVKPMHKHPSGVYITDIPYDAINDMANIDYSEAEERGYFKLDLLNVHVYQMVRDEAHLFELMKEPDWEMLKQYDVVLNLVHLSNHYYSLRGMKEPVNSIPRLAMFLAAIRPSKKHLLKCTFAEMAEDIWDKEDGVYAFKKSHSLAYAQLVVVHLNLIKEYGLEQILLWQTSDHSDASTLGSTLVELKHTADGPVQDS
jgi:hypothetical protein